MTEIQKTIIECLSIEITNQLRRVMSEMYHPGHNPDQMDDIIKVGQQNVAYLRKVREEFEDMFCRLAQI
jgi:hypothetical protein